jgi:hypothetical protein
LQSARPVRVWNGIFATGDERAKTGPGDVRPEIGDHDAQEMATKTAFLLRVSEDWVVADAFGCERVSKTNNREFFEYFDQKQAPDELMAVRHSKFESDPS